MKIKNKKAQDETFMSNIFRYLLWAVAFVILFFAVRFIIKAVQSR